VSYKDTTLKGGFVAFVMVEGGRSFSSRVGEDGGYKVENVPLGPVTIAVETQSLNPAGRKQTPKYGPPPGTQGPGGYTPPPPVDLAAPARRYVPIPPK